MYYEVYVASARYQKSEPLTYASDLVLRPGDVVIVPLGKTLALGFVHAKVSKPNFICKPITRPVQNAALSKEAVRLFAWMQQYYPSGSGVTAQLFLPSSLITKKAETLEIESEVRSHESSKSGDLPPLSPDQKTVITAMNAAAKPHFLLHGETGSGKTRVYIERAKAALKHGKSAVILTPEIGLTPQLEATFRAVFGEHVLTMHSNLTSKKRREYWLKIALEKEPLIVIGPRSALFSPLKNIGLIVMDEFHEPAYKQEQAPKYQTIRVVGKLAQLHNAEAIYGSATPPVADYYYAQATGMPILRMQQSAKRTVASEDNIFQTQISTIDLKDKSHFSRHPFLSDELLGALERNIAHKEQSLIYLNRRGTARVVLCQNCGWQALCPHCDLPLTYHGDNHHLRCHTCGFTTKAPLTCEVCQSAEIQYKTMGTKALVDTLQGLLPHAKIQRFDTDLGVAERMDKHYENIRAGNVDILVGTQMLGKGLDLPKLSLVGIVAADTSLNMPDFTAGERSYQLLHQVLGRVGRGHIRGRVIVQTYMPENAVLGAAITKNYAHFYETELSERKAFVFPPFCFLLKITVSRKSSNSAEKTLRTLHTLLSSTKLKVRLSEPAPGFYEHTHGLYHWQLVLKAVDRNELLKAIETINKAPKIGDWSYDLDPANLL